jgi:hypothetical protein
VVNKSHVPGKDLASERGRLVEEQRWP